MNASIKDVAKKAQVSVSTVSRALNGYLDVNEETRKKVEKAAMDLGYYPNISARNLSAKNKRNVGLIVSGLLDNKEVDEYTLSLLKGVYSYIDKTDINIAMIAISTDDQNEKSFNQLCREYSILGAVLYGLKSTDPYVTTLKDSVYPCVTIDINIEGDYVRSIMTDDISAFEKITDYVIDNGHKKLVLVNGRPNTIVAKKRYKGFCDSLKKHGINIDTVKVIDTDFKEEKAYKNTLDLLQMYGKEVGTAFICMSDLAAIGVINAIRESGYNVPEDFSVTGFDGISMHNYIHPVLATINQNTFDKGYEAAKLLIDMIENNSIMENVVVSYNLDTGKSVRKI